ncbi:MAG: TIGR00730 family Rossman fold protein [Pseudomonadota bacterium]
MPPNKPERSVCLFCGSRTGTAPHHLVEAEALGAGLADAGFGLVYGAGDLGLMGAAARAAKSAGGQVTGFIPRHLLAMEVGNPGIDALIVTETMHERKKLMFGNSDAVVALPGGPGTLDELIEVLTWRQIGLHQRPIVLVSPKGYWQPLLSLIDHVIGHGFADPGFRDYLDVVESAGEAVVRLKAHLID